MTHQFDPAMLPDSDFALGTLAHLVVGNSGRMLDPRRTPIRIVGLDPLTGTFLCEVLAFEDCGARWQLPFESVASFQFVRNSVLADPTDVHSFQLAVHRFDRPLEISLDTSVRERTLARVSEARSASKEWLDTHLQSILETGGLDLSRPVGDSRIWQSCEDYFRVKGLWEIEDKFAAQYVSNPYSGEFVKGHRIVLAELGLAAYRDRILRDERTFEGAWNKAARGEHIIARMAFVQELFSRAGFAEVSLHRGIATDAKPEERSGRGLLSASFSYEIANSMLGPTRAAHAGVVDTAHITIERLFMTYQETAHLNRQFQEAEAVLIEEPDTGPF
jgi:hypothetical protein